MSFLSVPNSVALAARRNARALSLAGIAAATAIGGAACRSPKPGYFGVALIPESQQALVSRRAVPSTVAEPVPVRALKAELREWKISLNGTSVSSGRVTIEVHNSGTTTHSFEIEGNGIEQRTRPVAPDSTVSLSVDLKPGKYEIYCPLGSGMHRRMGMKADLTVQSAE
ncbi:MAG TPA: cupredoxin domain-containing protein [Gemmatimonadaceae bacterium]|nr:cupredoxin domain-containing protein [Gemmatimonadaceae bacterium]